MSPILSRTMADGGPVSHPPLYSWEDVLCLLPHICAIGCRLCSYVCQIHLSTWKCWKIHSSPVFDKSYYTNVLAHTLKKKRRKLYPLFQNSSQTFQTSLFQNNDNNENDNNYINNNINNNKNRLGA